MKIYLYIAVIFMSLTQVTPAFADEQEYGGQGDPIWSVGMVGGLNYSISLEKNTGQHRTWLFQYQPPAVHPVMQAIFGSSDKIQALTIGYKADRYVNGTGTYYYTGIIVAGINGSFSGVAPTIAAGYQWQFNRLSVGVEGSFSLSPISAHLSYRL